MGAGNLTQVPSPALRVLQEKANIHNSLGALCSFLGFAKPVTTSAYLFLRNLLRSYLFPLLSLPSRTRIKHCADSIKQTPWVKGRKLLGPPEVVFEWQGPFLPLLRSLKEGRGRRSSLPGSQ